MSTVLYPAIFHKANLDEKGYWVEFPDLPGCFSQGDTFEQAYQFAQEALGLYLDDKANLDTIHTPSLVESMQNDFPNETIMLIAYDSLEYAKKYKNRAIKKTLSIPEWLNDEATKKGINFSQALQEALLNKLNLQ